MKQKFTILIMTITLMLFMNFSASAQQTKSTCCDLRSAMHKLWEDHITWTRNVILNIIDDLPGTTEAVNRLLQNQDDIGNAIKPYYGEAAGNQLTSLLRSHITIAADLLTALKTDNTSAFNTANAQWVANADAIAAFLSSANPAWSLQDMTQMMHDHLKLTAAEAVARKTVNYAADITAYDNVHVEILQMADMLTDGIIKQFPNQFRGCGGGPSIHMMVMQEPVSLNQNVPNPAAGQTVIAYTIPGSFKQAQIVIYDQVGNKVKAMNVPGRGDGTISVDLTNLRGGLYKYSIIADGRVMDTKTLLH